MISALAQNFLLGFAISAVPGAVLFEVMRRSLNDRSSAYHFLLGNYTGMTLVMIGAFLGIELFANNQIISNSLYVIGGILLVYLGFSAIQQTAEDFKISQRKTTGPAYLAGTTLAIANPVSILFWTSLVGQFLQRYETTQEVVAHTAAVFVGSACLFALIILVIRIARQQIPLRYLIIVSKLFGAIIIVYGLVMLWAAVS